MLVIMQDRFDTSFIKFLAIVLITNSHLHGLYPFPQLATGGAIGNSLFFMISGYGLVKSETRQQRPFIEWYRRRFARIYPSLIITVAIYNMWLDRGWQKWALADYVSNFIWPTPAWFVSAIMLFYLVFFMIMKIGRPAFYILGILFLYVPYFYYYFSFIDFSRYSIEGPGYFKWIFYLQVMFFGGYLASKDKEIKAGKIIHFAYLIFLLACYFLIIMAVKSGFGEVQALIHIITFPIVFLVLALSRSHFVMERIGLSKPIHFAITLIGSVTLEIYLLQYAVYTNNLIRSLFFPVDIIVFGLVVLVLAVALANASKWIQKLFSGALDART